MSTNAGELQSAQPLSVVDRYNVFSEEVMSRIDSSSNAFGRDDAAAFLQERLDILYSADRATGHCLLGEQTPIDQGEKAETVLEVLKLRPSESHVPTYKAEAVLEAVDRFAYSLAVYAAAHEKRLGDLLVEYRDSMDADIEAMRIGFNLASPDYDESGVFVNPSPLGVAHILLRQDVLEEIDTLRYSEVETEGLDTKSDQDSNTEDELDTEISKIYGLSSRLLERSRGKVLSSIGRYICHIEADSDDSSGPTPKAA